MDALRHGPSAPRSLLLLVERVVGRPKPPHRSTRLNRSAAAAGAAAAFADVAGAGGAHLGAAGPADRGVGGHALELLQELGGRVDLDRDLAGRSSAGTTLHRVGGQGL